MRRSIVSIVFFFALSVATSQPCFFGQSAWMPDTIGNAAMWRQTGAQRSNGVSQKKCTYAITQAPAHTVPVYEAVQAIMPVSLAGLNAAARQGATELMWCTFSESSNLGFLVERMTERSAFAPVAVAEGARTSTAKQAYVFTDTVPLTWSQPATR